MWKAWCENNIFKSNKVDIFCYLFIYIILPIAGAVVNLKELNGDNITVAYSYWTIMLSALGCIYDAINRWCHEKSIINTKLLIIIVSNIVILIYCIVEIYAAFIGATNIDRADGWLIVYLNTVVIAILDMMLCVADDIMISCNVVDVREENA